MSQPIRSESGLRNGGWPEFLQKKRGEIVIVRRKFVSLRRY